MRKDIISQGDLTFIPLSQSDADYVRKHYKRAKEYGFRADGIIQEGEATGHHHKIVDPTKADLYRPKHGDATIIPTSNEPVQVMHDVGTEDEGYIAKEQHQMVTLDPSQVYRVHIDQETDPETQMARRVVD